MQIALLIPHRTESGHDFAKVIQRSNQQADHAGNKNEYGSERRIFDVEAKTEQQTGGDGGGKRNQCEQETTPNNFRALFDGRDLRAVSFSLLRAAISGGVVFRVHELTQPSDDPHKTDIDGENQQRRRRNKDGWRKKGLKQAADVIHGTLSRLPVRISRRPSGGEAEPAERNVTGTILERGSMGYELPHCSQKQFRLIYKCHVPALRQNHQLRSGNLLVHLLRHLGIALVVLADDDQRRHFDLGETVHVFNFLQITVNDELAVRAPHFAVNIPCC